MSAKRDRPLRGKLDRALITGRISTRDYVFLMGEKTTETTHGGFRYLIRKLWGGGWHHVRLGPPGPVRE